MKVFQTKSGKKTNLWHIYTGETHHHSPHGNPTHYFTQNSLCNSGTYWVGGYHEHNDFKKFPKAIVEDYNEEIHGFNLCPACLIAAYQDKKISVSIINDNFESIS